MFRSMVPEFNVQKKEQKIGRAIRLTKKKYK